MNAGMVGIKETESEMGREKPLPQYSRKKHILRK
jgi:hypothetical protein